MGFGPIRVGRGGGFGRGARAARNRAARNRQRRRENERNRRRRREAYNDLVDELVEAYNDLLQQRADQRYLKEKLQEIQDAIDEAEREDPGRWSVGVRNSSWINAITYQYDQPIKILEIRTRKSGTLIYMMQSERIAALFRAAGSKGQFYNRVIKGRFPYIGRRSI